MPLNQDAGQELLESALAAVKGAKVPEDLRPTAFAKAIDLLAGKVAPATGGGTGDGGGEGSTEPFTGDERFAKIAQETGAEVSKLPYVFDIDDDGLTVLLKRSRLSAGDAPATRELALLLAAGRQAAGYEATTKIETVRDAVENMGVNDSKNFSTDLSGPTSLECDRAVAPARSTSAAPAPAAGADAATSAQGRG